jgi:predicted nuclease of predicted toxin-antitoxin system
MTNIHPKSLRIYVDESVNVTVAEGLKRRGINAFSAKDLGKLGITDEEQLETAVQNKAAIFTHDADFLRIAAETNHWGIIYVHQQKISVGECIKKLKVLAETTRPEEIRNKIIFL